MRSTKVKRGVLALAVLLAVRSAASAADAVPPRSASWIIVPGESIGPVRLGMSPAEVTAALGKPVVVTDGIWWKYERDGLSVVFDVDKPVVARLIAAGARPGGESANRCRAHTEAGVGVGSTREQVLGAFGRADNEERDGLGSDHLHYRSLGLGITMFENRAMRVEVTPRSQGSP